MFAALIALCAFAGLARAEEKTILVYGDSLMAGYQLPAGDGFVPQLQLALDALGVDVTLVNASISGDTTEMGLARLDWSMAEKPDAAILGLGANDMLMGLPVDGARQNLSAILDRFAADGVPVLLMGMMANRSLGPDYVEAFDGLYPALAQKYGALLYPFFLDGVAFDPKFNLGDRVHPNAEGIKAIIGRVLPFIVQLLEKAA